MKAFNIIMKIIAAIVAIAGIVYIAATYGDKIVAWCKKMLGKLECLCGGSCDCCCEECSCQCDADCDECPCEDDCDNCSCGCEDEIVEEDTEEAAPAEETVQAEEADFEG